MAIRRAGEDRDGNTPLICSLIHYVNYQSFVSWIQSEPPRGSGWVRRRPQTQTGCAPHPLPQGGSDYVQVWCVSLTNFCNFPVKHANSINSLPSLVLPLPFRATIMLGCLWVLVFGGTKAVV